MIGQCKDCIYRTLFSGPDRSMIYQCRFNPPQVVAFVVPVQQGLQHGLQVMIQSQWPVVADDGGCAQFKAQLQ